MSEKSWVQPLHRVGIMDWVGMGQGPSLSTEENTKGLKY